ncbi:pentatricopeptide repeat-containing protein At1g51965, mitochondrial-like [Chenopodium quinoa]|uniref:pentatricopeptide repeat-containing protein At1g51965, mitochondrial-like n=1 Tax=Chenopodium quinoa TaxID=63459 RepID=UPI000B784A5D|nr:pentatricopeptide repeat-containing protein At1g51965, mitochondrial-like [Chenopodium quinoa]
MKLPLHFHHHRQLRHYATKYTAKITSTTTDGRTLSAEVHSPSLPSDARGFPLPRRDLICKITQILKSPISDPFSDLSNYLQTLTLTLTPSEASLILKSLNNSPHLSLKFFHFCPSFFPNFRHDTFSYNRLLHILSIAASCGGSDWVEKCREAVAEMERDGVYGNISTVNILIGVLGAPGVDWCLGLVKKWGLQLNSYTYKCILQAYLRSYETEKAFEVFKLMRRKGYTLDVVGYNMLLHALAKINKVDQAYMVFEDMKRKICEPDEYTYTIMVRMTGKMGKPDESLALFQEMLGKGLAPNLMAYNTMIEALVKNRMAEKTIFLFSKMIESNCRPNEFTYSLILTVLVAEGQLGKLDEVVELSNKYITKSMYAYLVRTLSKLGHASEAHRLFCNMWAVHDKGDRDACMSMIESLCTAGKTVEAIDLLDKIHEKGIDTDIMMYNTVLSALGRSKQISHLHDLFEKMKRDGPPPDIFSYNILISSFGRVGKVDEAVKIFEQLEDSDFKPDIVSYNSLINCLGKNGDLDEAHMRFREMVEKGLNPDVVTYSTLIECFGKTDKVEMASRMFDDMVAQGCSPNIVTYNILLDCFERSGKTAEAVDLYAKLKEQGLTPDFITYAILERLQSGSHRTSRIRKQNPITGWVVSPLR